MSEFRKHKECPKCKTTSLPDITDTFFDVSRCRNCGSAFDKNGKEVDVHFVGTTIDFARENVAPAQLPLMIPKEVWEALRWCLDNVGTYFGALTAALAREEKREEAEEEREKAAKDMYNKVMEKLKQQ